MRHVYCPECGFQNPEAANYCSRCGALLVKDEPGSETTMSYTPEEAEEGGLVSLEDLGAEGPALVVRSGGGRAGEHFVPQG
ncbi:MAG TPA: zinc ribbon domain-containing protein, partial [Gaiellaceae bacterium]|nr:zinc ribbon domain-containing protein [Gaiellaceae bacterium]